MLLQEFDPNPHAVIDPSMVAERIEDFPEITVSCFSRKLFESALACFEEPKQIATIRSAVGPNPLYEVAYRGKRLPFSNPMWGNPSVCASTRISWPWAASG